MANWPRRKFLHTAGLGAGALLAPRLARQTAGERRRPNVLFILIDDLGWMDTTVYGSRYYETPGIERLAQRSMVFTDAYAANPLCSPTRASILTGMYPARWGLTLPAGHLPPLPSDHPLFPPEGPPWQKMLQPESARFLPLEERTLAEALKEEGYRTGFIGKWHLGQPEEYWPQYQGFDVNIGGGGYPSPPSYFSPYRIKPLPDGPEGEYIADRLTDESLRFLESHRDEPFFLCLWHYSVHAPYQAKEAYIDQYKDRVDPRGKQANPVMAAMIKSMDESIGRVLDKLDALGLTQETIIFFFSDNGGNMYDRVPPGNWPPTNNAPLRSGKGSIYEGGVRVPLMVCWPGVVKPGSRCSEVVSSVDFYPTILEMVGARPEPNKILDGESLVPLLRRQGKLKREAIFCHFPHGPVPPTGRLCQPCTSVRKGDWKLIRFYETSDDFPNEYELYNLREDIGETNNLAGKRPAIVKELAALIEAFLQETKALVPIPNPNYDPRALPMLDGWQPSKWTVLSQGEGVLLIDSIGGDPFVRTAEVPEAEGKLVAKFRLRSTSSGSGQFFWADAQVPNFGPAVRIDFQPVHDGQWHEYEMSFTTQGKLRQLRLDPSSAPGHIEIDWIRLCQPDGTILKSWDFGG
ncbi:MAG: sulfatase [Candidatus Zipacnadales bacterium]